MNRFIRFKALFSIVLCFSIYFISAKNKPKEYIHFIMYGQSLSTGHESWATISAENVKGNYMIGDQIWINYGNKALNELQPLRGSVANATKDIVECPLLGTANHIQKKFKNRLNIIATSAGTSGEPIEDLSKESQVSTYYQHYLTALESASAIAKNEDAVVNCPAIFWMQGEWNYQGHGNGLVKDSKPTFDKDEYKSLMIRLKDNMQADAMSVYGQYNKPYFYTYQVGAQYTKGKSLSIGMAQLEASNEYDDIICAGPAYPVTDVGGHLDANGYRWYGEMLGKVYYKTKVLGEDFKPLQPYEVSRDTSDTRNILIRFLVPQLPLVLDTLTLAKEKDFGFEVYLDDTRQKINKVSIQNNTVILTCDNDLKGLVEVIYGSSNTRGHGNLRDSDDYKAFFPYEDLDKKDKSGQYIYPRPDNKQLRPAIEPKDSEGNIIYNKPYPLYNFSVAFYYKINQYETAYTVPNLKKKTD